MKNNVRHSVGDRVLSLIDTDCRKKGDIVTVKRAMYCGHCGVQHILYGDYISPPNTILRCGGCKNLTPNFGYRWGISTSFAPLTESTLQNAVEEENYELASIIRDALKTEKV